MHLRRPPKAVSNVNAGGWTPGWRILLVGLAVFYAASCRPAPDPMPQVSVAWTLEPTPPSMGPAVLRFMLTDTVAAQPVSGAAVQVEGNMAHAGMAPWITTGQEVAPGQYEALLEFTMAGDWVILLDAMLPDGRTLHRQLDVPGVKGK